jgi:hypothetical protein
LRIVRVVLLLQVSRCVLSIGGADPGAHDRARSRSDAGAAVAADRGTERHAETSAKNSAANRSRISLVAQRGDLRVGILPTCQVIIGRLRHHAGAHCESCQTALPKVFMMRFIEKIFRLKLVRLEAAAAAAEMEP